MLHLGPMHLRFVDPRIYHGHHQPLGYVLLRFANTASSWLVWFVRFCCKQPSTGFDWTWLGWPGAKGLRRSGGGGGDGEVVGAHGTHRGPRGGPGRFEEAEGARKTIRDGREGMGDGDGGEEPSWVDHVQLELHAMEERAMRIGIEE